MRFERSFLWACALLLASACTVEPPETAAGAGGANTSGGVGGSTGGVGGATGGVGGASGGAGGATGGAGGASGGAGGASGGVGGMMAGQGGMTGGVGGEGGMTGGMGGMGGMGGEGGMGGGDPTAECIANAAADGRTGACPECSCMKCLPEIMNCQDEACRNVVSCGQDAGCSGSACYCGTAPTFECAVLGMAMGACITEIETAAGVIPSMCSTSGQCAQFLTDLPEDNPVSRARALSICSSGQRFAEATTLTEEVPEIMGMCQTECMPTM